MGIEIIYVRGQEGSEEKRRQRKTFSLAENNLFMAHIVAYEFFGDSKCHSIQVPYTI